MSSLVTLIGLTAFLGDQGAPEDYRKVYAPDVVWRMGEHVQFGADEIVAAAVARRAEGVSGTGTRLLVTPPGRRPTTCSCQARQSGRPVLTTTSLLAPGTAGRSPAATSPPASPSGTRSRGSSVG
ncbi:MAG TPA: hypothetical protein VHZ03_40200 [Trebonia sp.]|nr:hypothetical protein [Trebonia sp.]